MNRRDFLRLMLATAAAEAVDFEHLLWVPKPIVTVPAMPYAEFTGGVLKSTYVWWRNVKLPNSSPEEFDAAFKKLYQDCG